MPLGILQPKGMYDVPGTTLFSPDNTQYFDGPTEEHSALKCDNSGRQPIILNPQPSDDPNDPLNWPLWRRDIITFILCWAAILATSLGSILAANTLTISILFSEDSTETISITKVALLTGYFLLGAGVSAIFFVPSGRVWGKRHLFLLGICLIIASSAWAGSAGTSYGSLAAARAIQGIGAAPFESLINAAVGDLYFVHQRGTRMAFTNLAVFGGAFFTPIVSGKITESLGWPWTFYFVAIFMAATLPAVFFLCPETAYRRELPPNTDSSTEDNLDAALRPQEQQQQHSGNGREGAEKRRDADASAASQEFQHLSNSAGGAGTPKKTFAQSLYLFDGRKTDERYWVLLLRPFPLLANPAFIWGCLIQGTMIAWTVFIGVIVAALFIGPPYWWGEVEAGYAYVGAFLGAFGGFGISGFLADTTAKWLTKRNHGIYEPEFRIFLVIPMLITGGIGLFGFALTAGQVISHKFTYVVPLVFFGFEVASMVIGAVASSLYIVDAYRDLTIEGFTIMIIFKNLFSFGMTFKAYDWFSKSGVEETMIPIAAVQMAICLLSIPMYIFGKCCRAFYHKHDLLALTRLR